MMQLKRLLASVSLLLCATLLPASAAPLDSGTANTAFQVARKSVPAAIQNKVISLYGVGTPEAIQKWYIIFYDPSVASHGRVVLVEGKQVTKSYPANGGAVYTADLTFNPSHVASEGPALSAAQGYAAKRHLIYDSASALFKLTSAKQPYRWKINLLQDGKSLGSILVNTSDASVTTYAPPTTKNASSTASTTTTTDKNSKGFFHDVKKTFLGIGGDMEEFFTGDRTVDKDN